MDISILLGLQAFREGAGAILTEIMAKMTWFAEANVVLVIMALIYWCINKETGTYLLMGWSGNRIVNGLMKVTVCAYRPWIRDARVIPDATAKVTATGYSFPSGHTMNAASLFGGMAIRKGVNPGLKIMCWILLFLVAFSRVFLCVHHPQDVLLGAAAGLLVMFLTGLLLKWLESHPNKDILVAVIGVLIAVAVAVFAAVKTYPEDYDAEGKLLVDGLEMAKDTFKAVGWASGFLIGWVLERRFVHFSIENTEQLRFLRLTGGLLGYYIISLIFNPIIKILIPGGAGIIVTCFLQMFYIIYIFPLIIMAVKKRNDKKMKTNLQTNM